MYIYQLHEELDWYSLSQNKNMTLDIILTDLLGKRIGCWNYQGLSKNPNITIEFIFEKIMGLV
jgi:hypothetical protein